ncbi:MAG: glycosyltransferase family 4 protein [Candidatus Nanohaloarchaea archaeon]
MNRKILLLGWGYPPNIDGGLDIHVKHLFDELKSEGIEVTLVLPEGKAPDREDVIGVETGDGDMIQKARRISQETAKIAKNYDIIHTHDWFGAEAGYKAKKYSETNWVSTFHSLSTGRSRTPMGDLYRLEEAAAKESDELIAVSEKLGNEVEAEFERTPRIIHNGFSMPKSTGKDVKEELGIDGKMLFYVGRHAEQKGLEHLLYGFSKLDEDATLVLGGEGHMTDSLKQFVDILGIEGKVIFEGFIPDTELGDYYRAADVFVSPSINEPFGLTITEALESGTPVVATESGVNELVGSSIITVEPDSDSIRSGIIEAFKMERPDYETRIWSEMADEVIEVYREIG